MHKLFCIALVTLLCLCSTIACAQTWTSYSPPEGDFRVLMPTTPSLTEATPGSIEYRSQTESVRFSVFRHDPRNFSPSASGIAARLGGSDLYARNIGQDDTDLREGEFLFRLGSSLSMHKLVSSGGRQYELVLSAVSDDGMPRQLARDFFASFQSGAAGGAGVFTPLANLPTPDSCKSRGNAFARTFCEYLTCQVPANAGHTTCAVIPKLFR